MSQNLQDMGLTVVPFGQGFKDMSPPSKKLMKLVMEGRIRMVGTPYWRGWSTSFMYEPTLPGT